MNFIFFIFCTIEISLLTYYFQIKEYRFDRLIAAIKEQGFLYFLIPEKLYLPKKSVRNLNIILISVFFNLFYLAFNNFYLNMFSPLLTIANVCIGVLLTGIISENNRNKIILKAQKLRKDSNTKFIGITGSFGKSSTKEFLTEILSTTFKAEKTLGNYNTNIGVAISLNKNLKHDTQYFVTEMGAYKIGEIKEITNWIKPQIAIITGLSNQHLSLFGSIEKLIKAKSELIESLPVEANVYINQDVEEFKSIIKYAKNKNIITYSDSNINANIYLKNYENGKAEVLYKNETFILKTNLIGKHNIKNLLPVIAIATDLGIPKENIISAVKNLKNSFGKLSMHKIKNKTFLYDGYSSNILGFLEAIKTLQNFESKEKIVVTKGIIELGKQKKDSYLKILNALKDTNIKLITSDPLFKKLDPQNLVTIIKSENKILEKIQSAPQDITILIEGRFSDRFINSIGIHE